MLSRNKPKNWSKKQLPVREGDSYIRGDDSIFAEFDGDGDVHNKLMTTATTMTTTLMMVMVLMMMPMMMMIAVSPPSPAGPMSAGPNIQRSLHCLSHCSHYL